MRPVAVYVIDAGSRQKTTRVARLEGADLLVIRIEQHPEPGMEFRVLGQIRLQQKRLEKPAHMRQVPFDRGAHRASVCMRTRR